MAEIASKVLMSLPGVDIVAFADGSLGWRKGKGGGGGKGGGRYNWIDEPECPKHGHWEWVQPGTRKDGSEYNGFWTCTNDDCLNRPGREWTKDIDPDDYMAEYATDDSAEDDGMDSLPF